MGNDWLGNSSAEEVIVNHKLTINQQCHTVSNQSQHHTNKSTIQKRHEIIFPLYSLRPPASIPASFGHHTSRKIREKLKQCWEQQKIIRSLANMAYKERLKELSLFKLQKRRQRGDMMMTFKYVKIYFKEEGNKLYFMSMGTGTNSSRLKLQQGRFR